MKINNFVIKSLIAAAAFSTSVAHAISIDWTGGYRIEYTSVNSTSLASEKEGKSYALNFLYLQPKIIGSDGVNIVSRFDIMPSQIPAYKNSQLGSIIGGGLNDGSGKYGSNVKSQNQNSMSLNVSQLYLNVNHEYGAFLVGRAPIEFGMGITHNAGLGAFDHWADTKEVISYRFTVDNLSFAPMLARVSQEDFGGGVSNEKIFMVDYNNKDAGARAGVFHQTRTGGPSYNDILLTPGTELPKGVTRVGGYKTQTINIFLERKWQPFEFKVEASFETGSTGVQTAAGEEINLDAYAVVAEALWPARDSKWQFNTRFGVVSGDNPDSANYEGYQLDKNYDVAMLMFNHRMGKADILGTSVIHANDSASGLSTQNSADDEAVSNVMFIAPSTTYSYNDKVDMKTSLVYGQLMTNTNNFVDFKKDLGLELDMELVYKPRERVTWSTGVGVLFPGAAWKAGNLNLDNKANFGLTTKAAITF